MTHARDIAHAISLGVDAIGLIFYNNSARYVSVDQAILLLQDLPPLVSPVAVFVNPDAALVEKVLTVLPIQWLQFHGEESPAFCEQFGKSYIKAVPATSTEAITLAITQHQNAAAILLDTPSTTSRGGSGVPFDWQIIPRQCAKPLMLAGGLDASNVRQAISACSPYAVDVCSGIEATAGVKDHEKMNSFVNTVWGKE